MRGRRERGGGGKGRGWLGARSDLVRVWVQGAQQHACHPQTLPCTLVPDPPPSPPFAPTPRVQTHTDRDRAPPAGLYNGGMQGFTAHPTTGAKVSNYLLMHPRDHSEGAGFSRLPLKVKDTKMAINDFVLVGCRWGAPDLRDYSALELSQLKVEPRLGSTKLQQAAVGPQRLVSGPAFRLRLGTAPARVPAAALAGGNLRCSSLGKRTCEALPCDAA